MVPIKKNLKKKQRLGAMKKMFLQNGRTKNLALARCYGLKCVPSPQNQIPKSQPPVPQNVTIFSNKTLKEVIKLRLLR